METCGPAFPRELSGGVVGLSRVVGGGLSGTSGLSGGRREVGDILVSFSLLGERPCRSVGKRHARAELSRVGGRPRSRRVHSKNKAR